jgi:hypothetical protein
VRNKAIGLNFIETYFRSWSLSGCRDAVGLG